MFVSCYFIQVLLIKFNFMCACHWACLFYILEIWLFSLSLLLYTFRDRPYIGILHIITNTSNQMELKLVVLLNFTARKKSAETFFFDFQHFYQHMCLGLLHVYV